MDSRQNNYNVMSIKHIHIVLINLFLTIDNYLRFLSMLFPQQLSLTKMHYIYTRVNNTNILFLKDGFC